MARSKKSAVVDLGQQKMNRSQRREFTRQLWSPDPGLPGGHPNAAGVDVDNSEQYVAVPQDRDEQAVRSFPCFTEDLRQLVAWLKRCRITTVALQSTGVYWIPLYDMLEAE